MGRRARRSGRPARHAGGAAVRPDAIAFLGRPRRGRRPALVAEFLQRLGAPAPVAFELFDDAVCRRANALSFGRYQLPTFDLARTRYVIGFGADFLGTWNSPLAQNAAYGRMRQGQPGVRAKFVQIEPRMSQTGASADEWVTVRPGTEGAVALGLAHVILRDDLAPASGAGRAGALIEGWAAGLPAFTPAEVERGPGWPRRGSSGWPASSPRTGPSSRSSAAPALAHANGLDQALAVNALNALVGSVGAPGGVTFTPRRRRRRRRRGRCAICWPRRPRPQLLLLDDANPVFAAPPAWKVRRGAGADPLHRLVRVVPRRHERARRSRPARSLVPRERGPSRSRSRGPRTPWRRRPARRCGRSTPRGRRPTCCSTSAAG